jgi:mannose-6-phosphate isomerase-like protein (cupin superfamily)
MDLQQVRLDDARREVAPDGSTVYLLASVDEGGTAVFELAPGAISRPVRHPRVQEVWYVLSGRGRMWRRAVDGRGGITDLVVGTSLDIPRNTAFQFRNDGDEPLRVLGVTAPPWAGDSDAEVVEHGEWQPSL